MIKTHLTIRKPKGTAGVIADISLPITLGRSTALLGKDEEIDRYVTEETLAAIPAVKDRELIRFRLKTEPAEARTLTPFFRNSGSTLVNTYESAGFSSAQVVSLTQGLARSMYIFELYDTQDTDTQRLLARSYTKGDDLNTYVPVVNTGGTVTSNTPLLRFATTGGTPTQISPMALPLYFTKSKPSGTVFLQISFFNSVTGKRVKMRRRLTGLSIADNRYIPLTYDAATRLYHLPAGAAIEIEEVPIPTTSAQAEIERQKRLALMSATPTPGRFEPLGPPTGANFTTSGVIVNPSGSTSGTTNGSTSGTTSGGTSGSTGLVTITVPNIIVTKKFLNASGAFFIPASEPCTSVATVDGLLTAGQAIYLPTTPQTLLTDGYYAYVIGGTTFPPPHVFQVANGVVSNTDVPNPYRVNIQLVPDVQIVTQRIVAAANACRLNFSSNVATDAYSTNGAISVGSPIYTGPDYAGALTQDGYYKYYNSVEALEVVIRIQNGFVTDSGIDCEAILNNNHDGGPVVVGP